MNKKATAFILISLSLALSAGGTIAEEMPVAPDELMAPSADMSGELMRQAQAYLIHLGLLDGEADGTYGPKTASALRAFQYDNGLEVTSAPDAQTMYALEAASNAYISTADVQARLIELGYLQGDADGKWGKLSAAALKLFQRVHAQEPTGEADDATLLILMSEDAKPLPEPLSSKSKGEGVVRLQERLSLLGFFDAAADGNYGKKTTAAVKAFQQHLIAQGVAEGYGLKATGDASSVTQLFLFDPEYSTYLRDIEPGKRDAEVKRVERRLYILGYMDMPADETLDDYALESLNAFRKASGLKQTDAVTRADIDAMFSDDAPVAEHWIAHDIVSGDTGLAVRAVQEALIRGGMTIKLPTGKYDSDLEEGIERLHKYLEALRDPNADSFSDPKQLSVEAQEILSGDLLGYVRDVKSGSKQAEILRVQRRLHTLYYLSRSLADGKFGGKSRDAVRAFQAENGLEETGVADEETQRLLFSDDALYKPYPYRVEVSIARQKVDVYERDESGEYALVQTFNCSTGLHNSTPRGIFLNGYPVNRWHYFEDFNCWAQYSFRIEGGIMFHSVIYSLKSENSLRGASVSALGSPASHGCIRLKVADAKWLFEHCEKGSLAIIIT